MKTVIEMAREAGLYAADLMCVTPTPELLERFAALVREDEREKQQEPVAWMLEQGDVVEFEYRDYHDGPEWTPLYTTPPTVQQKPVAYMHTLEGDVQINNLPAECYGDHWKREPLFKYPPTAALAARQMRDAAVKVCREGQEYCSLTGETRHLDWFECAEAIAAMPVPEVQWRDLTDDEIEEAVNSSEGDDLMKDIRAVIAKFKEVNNV